MIEPTRISLLAEVFGAVLTFFAFVLSGTRKPPPVAQPLPVPSRATLPSTRPPPAQPPAAPPGDPPSDDEPSHAPGDPPLDLRSMVALASHFPVLLRWLHWLRIPPRDAQDVAQEVMIAAYRGWTLLTFQGRGSESAARRRWLFAVTANVAKRYRRGPHHRREVLLDDVEAALGSPIVRVEELNAEELVLLREDLAEVDLDKLRHETSAARWDAFLGCVVEGLPVIAVAASQGVPASTIYTRIRGARLDLRRAILRARTRREHEEARARFLKSKK